jgi:uncharacterized protein (TIGR00251 family)
MEIPFKKSKKGITIKIKVCPKSAQSGISGIVGDVLKIKVNAPPVGGAANEELIEILSDKRDRRHGKNRTMSLIEKPYLVLP